MNNINHNEFLFGMKLDLWIVNKNQFAKKGVKEKLVLSATRLFCISAGDGTESDEGIEDDPLLSTTATDGGASLAYPLLPTEEGVNLVNQKMQGLFMRL